MNNFLHLIPATGWTISLCGPRNNLIGISDVVAFALRKDGKIATLIATDDGIEEVPASSDSHRFFLVGPSDVDSRGISLNTFKEADPKPTSGIDGLAPIATRVLRFIANSTVTVPLHILVKTFGGQSASIGINELILSDLIKSEKLWSYFATIAGRKKLQDADALQAAGRSVTSSAIEVFDLEPVGIEILELVDRTERDLGHGLDWERILCRARSDDVFPALDRLVAAHLITKYEVRGCDFYRMTSLGDSALTTARQNSKDLKS